jgi:hypothetical protein
MYEINLERMFSDIQKKMQFVFIIFLNVKLKAADCAAAYHTLFLGG